MAGHALKRIDDVVLLHEAHFAVDLREFRLAIGTQVLVAETFHNLEITVESRHHQQLLQSLRRLGKSIELPRIHARRNDKVASAFRRRAYEHRRFHFEEAFAVKVAAHLHRHLMAQFKIFADGISPQIKVAVLHAQIVAAIGIVFNRKRRHLAFVQHCEAIHYYLDVAGRHIRIFIGTLRNDAFCLYDVFAPKVIGRFTKLGVCLIVENKLRNAITVAKIDKSHASHFPGTLHPAGQSDDFSGIRQAKFSAGIGSIHVVVCLSYRKINVLHVKIQTATLRSAAVFVSNIRYSVD